MRHPSHTATIRHPIDISIFFFISCPGLPKADATIFNAEIGGKRTMICRRAGTFSE